MKWWVYIHDTVSERPYSLEELRDLVDFHPHTRVCFEGSKEWKRAGEVPALAPLFADSTGSGGGITAWEQTDIHGYGGAFLGSLSTLLFAPVEFYSGLNSEASVLRSTVFSMVSGVAGYTGMSVFGWFLLPLLNPSLNQSVSYTFRLALVMVTSAVLVPLVGALNGGFYHLVLKLFSLNRGGIGRTLKVFFYGTTPVVFFAVPGLGGLIAPVWMLVLVAIGLKVAHDLSVAQTVGVLLSPLLLVFAGILGLFSAAF